MESPRISSTPPLSEPERRAVRGAWPSLAFPPRIRAEPLPLAAFPASVGRAPSCTAAFRSHKHLSGRHCELRLDVAGRVLLCDLSTNGTSVNGRRMAKGDTCLLKDQDVVVLVKGKNSVDDFSFTFLEALDSSQPLNETLEISADSEGEEAAPLTRVADEMRAKEAKATPAEVEKTEAAPPTKVESQPVTSSRETESSKDDQPPPPPTKEESQKPTSSGEAESSAMAEQLQCSICTEVIHDCVTLQPCLHSFCSGCYSGWMGRSKKCPECRNVVERLAKNHLVNNVVDTFLKAHPSRKRSPQELAELDAQNRITEDMKQPPRKRRHLDADAAAADDDDDKDDDSSDSDESFTDEEEEEQQLATLRAPAHLAPEAPHGDSRHCRACPLTGATAFFRRMLPVGPQPYLGADGFRCTAAGANHLLCQCCYQPFPDRRAAPPAAQPQTCTDCGQFFCHLYWGCERPGCRGCLNKFRDHKFPAETLDSLICDNHTESAILKDYLAAKGLGVSELLLLCADGAAAGDFKFEGAGALHDASVLCFRCALRHFQELAYQYRAAVPPQDLPGGVAARADCYWGRACRTQRTSPNHAERLNHICEQTRFK